MTDKLLGLIYGAFIGDALALGPHWIYDTSQIQRYFHPITGYTDPQYTPYHTNKTAGDLTHYGDQSLVLLKSISSNKGFSLDAFKKDWLTKVAQEDMYLDHASKESLTLLQDANTGSSSPELGGFARSGPMFLLHTMDEAAFEGTLLKQVHMTHNNELLTTISLYFTRVLQSILLGTSVRESLERHANIHPFIYDAYENALASTKAIVPAITEIGQSCSSEYGLPGILTILLKEDSLQEALVQNCYAGGDSAARGMVLGMIYGARDGYDHLPQAWVQGLNQLDEIKGALDQLKAYKHTLG